MSQFAFRMRKSFGLPVMLVKFYVPLESGRLQKVTQRYIKFKQGTLRLDKDHEYPLKLSDWCEQSNNVQVMYRGYEDAYKVYRLEEIAVMVRKDKQIYTAKEFAVNRVGEVAKGVLLGGQLSPGMVLLIITIVAGLMGGMLLGYFGLPVLTGQHLVANPPPS